MSDKAKTRLSESYFFNSAMYYLQRYASTEANLNRVLQRKIIRATQRGEEIPAGTQAWITKAVEKCVALGLVNDRLYTESKINSMRREGRSTRFISQTLQQKGVPREIAAELLQNDDDDNIDHDLQAALRYIKRRRLGKLSGRDQTPETHQKDLAKLMRAGFALNTARQALAHDTCP